MKANKMMAMIVVSLMLFSTFIVLNSHNVRAAPVLTPGVNIYGNATTDIVYGQSYASGAIKINSSQFTDTAGGNPYGAHTYRLFYPVYQNYSNSAYFMTWKPFYIGNDPDQTVEVSEIKNSTALDTGGSAITFNRSGLWIFDNNAIHASDDPTSFTGFIWVNTSTVYSIESIPNIYYDQSGSLTVTVDTKGDTGCMVSITDPGNATIYHSWRSNGQSIALDYQDYFGMVGTYTVKAYRDLDTSVAYRYPDQNGENYSAQYGNIGAPDFPANYTYSDMGPWNPPEKNASQVTFDVKTAAKAPYLNIVLSNTSFYWGYPIHIDVNVTNQTGIGLDPGIGAIRLKKGGHLYLDHTSGAFTITDETLGNYTITMPWFGDNPTPWTNLYTITHAASQTVNGSWSVVFADGDNFNGSAGFTISSSHPPVQLLLNSPSNKKIDVPTYIPASGHATITTIDFSIYGKNSEWPYYGFSAKDDEQNITISGDILYPVDAYPGAGHGEWKADVTPTKPGGHITVTIDWPDNGTASQTINIINGTTVTPAASKFTVGNDFNLTVTVTDVDGDNVKTAHVYAMWENDILGEFNDTTGDNTAGNGKNGEYTFWIIADDQPDVAPQNITIAAIMTTGYWGYATVLMDRNHDMTVNCTPTTSYAGNATTYNITVGRTGGGHPASSGLTIALYNETGALVTGDDAWDNTGDYSLTDVEIPLSGGVFHLFAYNDTDDSQDNNATITVTKYSVASSPSALAWHIDNDTNITFQVTPAYSGLLTLNNVTSAPSGADPNETSPLQITIEDGVGTVTGFNADMLGNITYSFEPSDGEDRPADGLTRVTTATATPVPANIYINEAITVVITVTHPATHQPIADVWVSLDRYNSTNLTSVLAKLPTGKKTDSAGQVSFAVNALASGNVTIFIENASDPDNPFYIIAGGRNPMSIILTSPSVDEGKQITADIKSGSTLVTGVNVTITFAGTTTTTTDGHITLTAPSVATNIPYTITATAVGYADATAQVTVLNVPKLIIAVLTSNIKAGQDFQIAVADDTGTAIIGATVTLQGTTVHTGAGGVVTMKAPSTQGNYTITATFGNYESASQSISVGPGGGIPGFELVTLLIAAGIAFLLIRRRRN